MNIFNFLYFVMCEQKVKLYICNFFVIIFSFFTPKSRYHLDYGTLELSCLLVLEQQMLLTEKHQLGVTEGLGLTLLANMR